MVIKFDNHLTSQHGGHIRKTAIFVPCSPFSLFIRFCSLYVPIIPLETGKKTLLAILGIREEQQAMMEVNCGPRSFRTVKSVKFTRLNEVCFPTLPSSLG